jgi:hypothetical protein
MLQNIVNSLVLMTIENDHLQNMQYEDSIDKFTSKIARIKLFSSS